MTSENLDILCCFVTFTLMGIINSAQGAMCASGTTGGQTMYTQTWVCSSTSNTTILQVKPCTSNPCMYIMGYMTDTNPFIYPIVRKTNIGDTSYQFEAVFKCPAPAFLPDRAFAIDSAQSWIYYIFGVTSSNVYLNSISGSSGSQHYSVTLGATYLNFVGSYCTLDISPDDTTLYISGLTSSKGTVCKVVSIATTSPFVTYCYSLTGTQVFGQIIPLQLDVLYIPGVVSTNSLFMMKIDISLPSPSAYWINTISCGGTCTIYYSKSALNNGKSIIYTLQNMNNIILLNSFSSSDGSVPGTRYVSSSSCTTEMAINANSIKLYIGFILNTNYYLTILDLSFNILSTFKFSTQNKIFDIGFVPSDNKPILGGSINNHLHLLAIVSPDSVLTSNTNITVTSSIISPIANAQELFEVPSGCITAGSFITTTDSCTAQAVNMSSLNYYLDDIHGNNLPANSHIENSITLSCSNYNGINVNYAFTADKGNPIPNWISIDMANSKLVYNTPNVTNDTDYVFNIAVTNSHDSVVEYITVYVTVKTSSSSTTSSSTSSSSSGTCSVQNCKICKANQNDRCYECNSGYQIYSSFDQCEAASTSSAIKTTQISTMACIISSALITTVIATLNFSSPQGLWIVLNSYQLLMLLLITGAYFPKEIADFFSGLKQVSFNYSFLPSFNIGTQNSNTSWFSFDLDNYYLEVIGMNSGSTIINLKGLFITILGFVCLNAIFLVLYRLTSSLRIKEGKFKTIMKYVFRYFTICAYLRLILQSNQFMLVCSAYEINLFNTQNESRKISLLIAICVYIFCIKMIAITLLQAFQARVSSSSFHNKIFEELFGGIKDTKASKYFTSMLMIRRAVFVSFLIFWNSLNFYFKIGILNFLQLICVLYQIVVRPFDKIQNSIVCIINDIEFICLSSLLFRYNKQFDWTQTIKLVFTGVIGATGIIVTILYMIVLSIEGTKKIMSCLKKNKTKPKENKIEENNNLSHNLSALNLNEEEKSNEGIKYSPEIKSKLKNFRNRYISETQPENPNFNEFSFNNSYHRPLDSSPYQISFNPSYDFSRPLPLDPSSKRFYMRSSDKS